MILNNTNHAMQVVIILFKNYFFLHISNDFDFNVN